VRCMNLEERIRRIEATEAIKRLKARYWYACDHKDVEGVRACFMDGPIEIDYAGSTGKVHHRDALRDVFEKGALRPEIVELHHGGPPRIELVTGAHARGIWSLSYHVMDTERRVINHVGGYYHDEYTKVDNEWLISKTRFEIVSAVTYRYKDDAVKVLHAAGKLPDPKQP
jgi:hypothetical protein